MDEYAQQERTARERFHNLFVEEHTDGSYYYATLRVEQEDKATCVMECGRQATVRWVDVEDESPGGAPYCQDCYTQTLTEDMDQPAPNARLEPFYKPTGNTATQCWEPGPEKWNTGWGDVWWLFLAPGEEFPEGIFQV